MSDYKIPEIPLYDQGYRDGYKTGKMHGGGKVRIELTAEMELLLARVVAYLRCPSIACTFEADEIESGEWVKRLLPEDGL